MLIVWQQFRLPGILVNWRMIQTVDEELPRTIQEVEALALANGMTDWILAENRFRQEFVLKSY